MRATGRRAEPEQAAPPEKGKSGQKGEWEPGTHCDPHRGELCTNLYSRRWERSPALAFCPTMGTTPSLLHMPVPTLQPNLRSITLVNSDTKYADKFTRFEKGKQPLCEVKT